MITYCTIITAGYFPVAKVLYESLQEHCPGSRIVVLVVDGKIASAEGNMELLYLPDIEKEEFFAEIERKYAHTNADRFRWALKPLLIGHLLKKGNSKVIFTDPDLYFVGQAGFLDTFLDEYPVLLTPHWTDPDVINNPDSVIAVMKGGMFNAGFVAANQNGLPAIQWWAGMCHYKMENDQTLGISNDQKYLDLLPVQFDNVHILKHQGCNLASWNINTCIREIVAGRLMINKIYQPVFIHFAKDTIANILNRNDILLKPFLDDYVRRLSEQGFDLLKNAGEFSAALQNSFFYKLKHRTRIRTRLKRFLYKLAEKL